MGIHLLQEFLETDSHGGQKAVNLSALALEKRRISNQRLRVVIDAENCLDRLYGGFLSDWFCGGSWTLMQNFLSHLAKVCTDSEIEVVIFFNGAIERDRIKEWYVDQASMRQTINLVFANIGRKGIPPSRCQFVPLACLRPALITAIRHISSPNMQARFSQNDHRLEVITFCRENQFDAIMAAHGDYAVFDPPRYFSSRNLKLTFKGVFSTSEFVMDKVARNLDLHPKRFCFFAALLGNHILTEKDLLPFYRDLTNSADTVTPAPKDVFKAVLNFVRQLVTIDDVSVIGHLVFRYFSEEERQEKIALLKQSLQHYYNGTRDAAAVGKDSAVVVNADLKPADILPPFSGERSFCDMSISEANDSHLSERIMNMSIDEKLPATPSQFKLDLSSSTSSAYSSTEQDTPPRVGRTEETALEVGPIVLQLAAEHHKNGAFSAWIYPILTRREVKLDVTFEPEIPGDVPTASEYYKPIRQNVYGILFSLNERKRLAKEQLRREQQFQLDADFKKAKVQVVVKEYVFFNNGSYEPDFVRAEPLAWKECPSVEKLWFGQESGDKERRLRAFLTCMRSDTPLITNQFYVPTHLIIFCCVMRYMLQHGSILRRHELEAFLATAVSPMLRNVQAVQNLAQKCQLTQRGIHLASLFMRGVETALFANDACGAPLHASWCGPSLFFDGRLFQHKLSQASRNAKPDDLCEGQIALVAQIDNLRMAILEGLRDVEWARAPLSLPVTSSPARAALLPAGMNTSTPRGRGRTMKMLKEGGKLEVAGMVVGHWGPTTSASSRMRGRGRGLVAEVRPPEPRPSALQSANGERMSSGDPSKEDIKDIYRSLAARCTMSIGAPEPIAIGAMKREPQIKEEDEI